MKPVSDETAQGPVVRFVVIGEEEAGQRLDNFLLREIKGVPRTRLYRALRKGEVRVNKGRTRADYRLVAGDRVRIPPLRQASERDIPVVPRGLQDELQHRVIFEDDDILVINKPSGLAVHGGSGLSFGLIESLRQARPEARYLELAHRLDRDTSGVILLAKKAAALRHFHQQLREKTVDKRYLALVAGKWPAYCRSVEAPLAKNVLQSGERMVRVSKEGRSARTDFSVLERLRGASLIEARPITGRTHQIRVHAQHVGMPLLGDDKYSDDKGRDLARQLGLKRLFLHASHLALQLPSGRTVDFQAPLDDDLEKLLDNIRK